MPVQFEVLDEKSKPIVFKISMLDKPQSPAEHYVACVALALNFFEQSGPIWEKFKSSYVQDELALSEVMTIPVFINHLHAYPHFLFDPEKMKDDANPNKEFYKQLIYIVRDSNMGIAKTKLSALLKTFKVPGISKISISFSNSFRARIFLPGMNRPEAIKLNNQAVNLMNDHKDAKAAIPLFLQILPFYFREYRRNAKIETGKELLSAYFNLGTAYLRIPNLEQAKNYLSKAVDLSKELNDLYGYDINPKYSIRLAECNLLNPTASLSS